MGCGGLCRGWCGRGGGGPRVPPVTCGRARRADPFCALQCVAGEYRRDTARERPCLHRWRARRRERERAGMALSQVSSARTQMRHSSTAGAR
eukprot:70995-Prymnesium_polylepis.1